MRFCARGHEKGVERSQHKWTVHNLAGKEDNQDKENLIITGFKELQTKTHTNLLPVKKPQTPLLVFIHFFFHPLFEEADVDAASTVT